MKKRNRDVRQLLKGSVCVFLSVILLPVISVAALCIDMSRVMSAKTTVPGAAMLACDSALSYYDRTLSDIYGLFAISRNMEEVNANVSGYFRSSVEKSGALEGADIFTRQFINEVFGSVSSGGLDYADIISCESSSCTLSGVKSSSLTNSGVLEKQILEYMKYRAPVVLTSGIVSKALCLSDTSDQAKAIERKIAYDRKLGQTEELCSRILKDVTAFNEAVSGSPVDGITEEKLDDYLTSFRERLGIAADFLLIYQSDAMDFCSSSFGLNDEKKKEYDRYTSDMTNEQKAVYIYSLLQPLYGKLSCLLNETEALSAGFILNIEQENDPAGLESAIDRVTAFTDCVIEYSELFNDYCAYGRMLEKICKRLSEKDKNNVTQTLAGGKSLSETVSECERFSQNVCSYLLLIRDVSGSKGKDVIADIVTDAYLNYKKICTDAIKNIDGAQNNIELLLKNADELEYVRNNWKAAIDDIDDGTIRQSFENDFEAEKNDFSKEAIESFRDTLSGFRESMTSVIGSLDGISVYNCYPLRDTDGTRDIKKAAEKISGAIGVFSEAGRGSPVSVVQQVLKENFTAFPSADGPVFVSAVRDDPFDRTVSFYHFLLFTYGSRGKTDEKEKQKAEELKKTLGNLASEADTQADLTDSFPESVKAAIPDEIKKEFDEPLPDKGNNIGSIEAGSYDSITEESLDSASGKLGSVSSFLEGIRKVLNAAYEDLCTEEYINGMFSCYTDTLLPKKGKIPETLSGYDMSSSPFFGAETEYILWGKDDPRSNVNCTLGTIYAIRFALNTVYAMTSADLRSAALTAATAIAGWTGFGIPIVENVILVAWSLAESAIDIRMIKEGKSVAIYKSSGTWKLGIGGIGGTLAQLCADTSELMIDGIFKKIEEASAELTDSAFDGAEKEVLKFIDTAADTVCEQVVNVLETPIENFAVALSSTAAVMTDSDIYSEFSKMLADIRSCAGGLVGECIDYAADRIVSSKNGPVISILQQIYRAAQASPEAAGEQLTSMIFGEDGKGGLMAEVRKEITASAKKKIGEYSDKYRRIVNEKIKSGEENVKNQLKSAVSDYIDGLGLSSSPVNGSSDPCGVFTALNYREYLRLFTLMNMAGGKNAMLERTSELIQINVSTVKGKTDFNLAKSPTMIVCHADVTLNTLLPLYPGGISADYGFESGKYHLHYSDVSGY